MPLLPAPRYRRTLAACLVAALSMAISVAVSAGPAAATGATTAVTSPATTQYFTFTPSAVNQFPVAGTASAGVTSVDVDCVNSTGAVLNVYPFAVNVPVTNGSWSTTATYPFLVDSCRLRAVPTGTPTSGDLSGFTGPVLYTSTLAPALDGGSSTMYGFTAVAAEGDGLAVLQDAAQCGISTLATIQTPALVSGPVTTNCSLSLPESNLAGTGSAVNVDGWNAYLPYSVQHFLNGPLLALGVAQTALTAVMEVAPNGDTSITETSPLMRCAITNAYPPALLTCPLLVPTGVSFQRVSTLVHGGHQVRVRDSFGSTDSAPHAVGLEYRNTVLPTGSGVAGFLFPGHGTAFVASATDQVLTGFGTSGATMLVRSDLNQLAADPNTDTVGLSWSRPPVSVVFSHASAAQYAVNYALAVPAGGTGVLGFAQSENLLTSATQTLGAQAITDMVPAPVITSPANKASIRMQTTTVSGTVSAGVNGMPTSVSVNGHNATITPTGPASAKYTVTFLESFAAHTLTVTAKDAYGNASSSAIAVTNSPGINIRTTPKRSSAKLTVPVACSSYFPGSACSVKVLIRNSRGVAIAKTGAYTIARGSYKYITVTMSPATTRPTICLYVAEPNRTYVLAVSKTFAL